METRVRFYNEAEDEKLKFAVVISRNQGKWVFCRHKDRDTYEVPGGHREDCEKIIDTARRELMEETGAVDYNLIPLCVFSVSGNTRVGEFLKEESLGMLYYADIYSFEEELHYEIAEVIVTDQLPENWTYPHIQPLLLEKAIELCI
ncbi:NUDIX hydrolase [Lacrimispora defluvii]|uniref:NUDIX domain-containing protein n=1 Tax=Lacrimispora defluvii TaxID=2719233 RepID=A0ABX1VRN1_9FIRM|nr:NUDIX domain-containing protein [Lacrimispora defluvii]NNJ31079.1 NUDIX domain-containing protein [Lacrimispora defluvii]